MKIILFLIDAVRAWRSGRMFETQKQRSERIRFWVLEYVFADDARQEEMQKDWEHWERGEFYLYRYWRRQYSVRR